MTIKNLYPSVLPSLNLDFANSRVLDPRVSFTRASTGTYTDSAGVLQTAVTNVPRFDHNPTTGESLGLLVEEQRTNLLTYSEDLSQWLPPFGATLTTNNTAAPDGAVTADLLLETTATSLHSCDGPAFVFVTGTTYTYSVYVKPVGGRNFEISYPPTVFTSRFARFSLSGGGSVQGTDAGMTASIQAAGNGWYRCSATNTCAAGAGARIGSFINNASSSRSYAGDATTGVFIWGAQLEAGSFPTSYIPTTSAATTRSADVASITGTNFSSWYRQDEGTVFSDATVPYTVPGSVFPVVVALNDGTTNNKITNGYLTSASAGFEVSTGGVSQAGIYPSTAAANRKFANCYRLNDFAASVNGGTVGTDTSGTVPTIDRLSINVVNGYSALNGTIKRLTYWPQRLPNSTLQAITQ